MKVLLYQGRSWISKAIKWQTRSKYSHVAVELNDGSVIEAWHKGGVRRIINPWVGHTNRTRVDFFSVNADFAPATLETWLRQQVGMKYDFGAIARFMSRRNEPADDRWFCSELVTYGFRVAGLDLLHESIPASHVSPRDVSISPYLDFIKSETR